MPLCIFDVRPRYQQTRGLAEANGQYGGRTVEGSSRPSLYLAEGHFIVHVLGLFLILAVAALALRTAGLLQGAPTAAVGAHRLSSKRQGGNHRRSGRFVVKNPLDLAHYVCVQLRNELKGAKGKRTATLAEFVSCAWSAVGPSEK